MIWQMREVVKQDVARYESLWCMYVATFWVGGASMWHPLPKLFMQKWLTLQRTKKKMATYENCCKKKCSMRELDPYLLTVPLQHGIACKTTY